MIGNKVSYGLKQLSRSRKLSRQARHFEAHPEHFKRIGTIYEKLDFKAADLRFPINVPLRFR